MNRPNGDGFAWCTYCGALDHTDKTCPDLDRVIHEKWSKIQKVLPELDRLASRGGKRP